MKQITLFLFSLCFLFTSCTQECPKREEITVATYNLRYNEPRDSINAWPNRKDWVRELIRFHDFELFGTQEGLIDQITYLAGMEEYDYVGVGRDDGATAGEHSAIFYKKERFEVLDKGNFWLSETPGEPSFGWDATSHRRICSWAKMKDKRSGKPFYFFSVHFDHRGKVARVESARLILQKIKEIAGDMPVIFVGDLNSRPDSEAIAILDEALNDAYKVTQAPPYGPTGTTNGFNWNRTGAARIDYIYTTDQVEILKYGVLSDSRDQRFPSDHFPVVARIRIK